MADPAGRYDRLAILSHRLPCGGLVLYRERRFLPAAAAVPPDGRVAAVRHGDRLDTFTARTIGDPLQFWRIADANLAMDPLHLAEPGALLLLPEVGIGSGR